MRETSRRRFHQIPKITIHSNPGSRSLARSIALLVSFEFWPPPSAAFSTTDEAVFGGPLRPSVRPATIPDPAVANRRRGRPTILYPGLERDALLLIETSVPKLCKLAWAAQRSLSVFELPSPRSLSRADREAGTNALNQWGRLKSFTARASRPSGLFTSPI